MSTGFQCLVCGKQFGTNEERIEHLDEYIIVFSCAILFLLITVFITLRQARRLPKLYIVEVVDIYGQRVTPDGLRLVFKTHDAAQSYAQFYRDSYSGQYRFHVIGVMD
jgi:hypothetical protein